jgi:cyclophilin family peptidyl-prolyl cis-trans isomerase
MRHRIVLTPLTNSWAKITIVGLLLFITIAGCGQTTTYEHEIQVQAAGSGEAVADAGVEARLGARDIIETTSNEDGRASFSFDEDQLDRWAKIVVEADGFQPKSILVKLLAEGPTSVVRLEPPGVETTGDQSPTEIDGSSYASTVELTADGDGQSMASEESNAPGPLAELSPAERHNYFQARPELTIDPDGDYRATIRTSKGDIVVQLNARAAPEHVNNFIYLSNQGFYDGLTFHRVEPGFVVQGGDPQGSGQGGPGYTVPGEFELKHGAGAVAMARLSDQANPDRESSGSQFYITLAPTPFLDGEYSVFGQVEAGMDVVQSIEIGDLIERITIDP